MFEQARSAIDSARAKLQSSEKNSEEKPSVLQWVGWGVIFLGFGGLILLVCLPFIPSGSRSDKESSNPLEVPTTRLFGFWEDSSHPGTDYWIARINQIEGNRFRIKWNGGGQRDGQGSGVAQGVGVIQANGTVRIELSEELKVNPGSQPLISLPGMSSGPKVQSLVLEGRYYQVQGGRSYFQGDYLERGMKFYPFTRWVLETDLPRGWKMPSR
jgi:hypothetical protein